MYVHHACSRFKHTHFEYMLSIVVLAYHVMAFICLYAGAPFADMDIK